MRWLVALISDTGLRLAEAAGLLKSDLVLDAEIPFVRVTVHPWRAVKTSGSVRGSHSLTPLCGLHGVSQTPIQTLLMPFPDTIRHRPPMPTQPVPL